MTGNDEILIIEKVNINDAKLLTFIKTEAYRNEKIRFRPSEDIIPKWFDDEWYTDNEETKRLIRVYGCYKIIAGKTVIGTFWLNPIETDKLELEDFCILPQYQSNGYGYKSLSIIEELIPTNTKWILGTPFYSVRNHHIYEKFGFKRVGTASEDTVYLYEKLE